MVWYKSGSITVTNSSTAVSGSGTQFVIGGQVGDGLVVKGVLYEIASINSDTSITLAKAYLASTESGVSDWSIVQTQSRTKDLNDSVTELVSSFGPLSSAVSISGSDIVLNADLNGDVAGNAATATKLATSRTISFSGDATGSLSFDGSADATAALTLSNSGVTAGTYRSVTVDAKGRVTTGTNPSSLSIDITGNAATATKWATGRTITLTGDLTGTSAAFDGSGNLSFATTLANSGISAGTYTKITVDAKGRATAGSALNSSDVTTALGFTPANKAGDTFTGNVGIGGAPTQKLEISTAGGDDGIAITNSSTSGGRIRLNSTGTGGRNYHIVSTANGSGMAGGKFAILDNTASDAPRLVINSSGLIGIGHSAPTANIDLQTSGDAIANLQSTGTIQTAVLRLIGRQASANEEWNMVATGSGLGSAGLRFVRGAWTNAPAMTITSANRIGIGTTSPNGQLEVTQTVAGSAVDSRVTNLSASNDSVARNTLSTGISNSYCIFAVSNGGGTPYRAVSNGSAVTVAYDDCAHHSWRTSGGTEKMYLTSGSTLVVNGGINSTNGLFNASNALVQGDGSHMYVRPTNSGSNLYLGSSNSNYMCIQSGGRVGIGTNDPARSFHVESDDCWAKLKRSGGRSWLIGPGTQDPLLFYDETAGIARLVIETSGSVRAGGDNVQSIGTASNRWTTVYATNGSINTSDEDYKAFDDDGFTCQELAAAREIAGSIRKYKWHDAIAEKGEDGARIHVGVGAQTVWGIMASHGLIDALEDGVPPSSKYAFLCWDEWDAEEAISDGEVISSREAGSRFSVRYDELNQFLLAAQECRLAALEAAVATIH